MPAGLAAIAHAFLRQLQELPDFRRLRVELVGEDADVIAVPHQLGLQVVNLAGQDRLDHLNGHTGFSPTRKAAGEHWRLAARDHLLGATHGAGRGGQQDASGAGQRACGAPHWAGAG